MNTGIATSRNTQLQNTINRALYETIGSFAERTPVSARNQRNLWRGSGTRKLILMSAIVVLSAGGSAQAQRNKPTPPPPFERIISVEDDRTGNFLVFGSNGGKYNFVRCSDGFSITGVGLVKNDGCSISLEDSQADHRVVASANECAQEAMALVEQFAQVPGNPGVAPFKVTLSDKTCATILWIARRETRASASRMMQRAVSSSSIWTAGSTSLLVAVMDSR